MMNVVNVCLLQWIHQQFKSVYTAESRCKCCWNYYDYHWSDVCSVGISGYDHASEGGCVLL